MKLKEFHDYHHQRMAEEIPWSHEIQAELKAPGKSGAASATPTKAELEQDTAVDIDIAVSKVFAAETIQDKLDRIAIAMQVIANITLNGVRQ